MSAPVEKGEKGGPRRTHDLVRSICRSCGDEIRTPSGAPARCPKCQPNGGRS